MLVRSAAAAAAMLGALSLPVMAQPVFDGFLCCNMRTDGKWISDSNYAESGKRIIPAGTPVRVTGYGRYRVHVELDGGKQDIGNDYSRDLDLGAFAQRYVVSEDPARKIATFAPKIRDAIKAAVMCEDAARTVHLARALGEPLLLESDDIDALYDRYQNVYGQR